MLSKKDLLILTELRKNARETLTSISKKTTIPVSTIFDKIRYYHGNLIKRHTTLIDFSQLGFNARANIMLKIPLASRPEAIRFFATHQNVNSAYKISNGYDYLIEGIFKNIKEVEDFIDLLNSKVKVDQIHVHYVVEDLKKEAFMNDKDLLHVLGV